MLQQIVNGLVVGSVYAMFAVGISIVFGNLNVVNFAVGEFAMLAAFTMVFMPGPFVMALGLTLVVVAVGSMVLYRGVFFYTVGRSHLKGAMVSLALSMIALNLALIAWGENPRTLPLPVHGSVKFLGIVLASERVFAAVVGLVVVVLVYLLLNRTMIGRAMRATMQQRRAARLVGILDGRIMGATFLVSSLMLAIGGVLWGALFFVFPAMGSGFLFKCFVIVVIGGLGSVNGALVAGLLFGLCETLSIYAFGPGFISSSFGIFLMIIVLAIRPSGLFGNSLGAARA
jgi:branched-chain amino acid transport system permease protein